MNNFAQLIPGIVILIVYALLFLTTKALIAHNKLKKRRSPFVGNFLRTPGESIRTQLEDLNHEMVVYLFSAMFLPLSFYSIVLSQAHFGNKAFSFSTILVLILLAALFEAYFFFKLALGTSIKL